MYLLRRRPVGTDISIKKKTSWDWCIIYLEEAQLGPMYLFSRRPAGTYVSI
jgi:hypothetical protein